jgi:branched-chain amino acid aminotransferase
MLESKLIWMNGELVEWKQAKVHVLTHALHYGTAVFEGIRCFSTERGPEVFRLREHIVRLIDSTKIYLMNFPLSVDEICRAVKETVAANRLQDCYVRPIAYYSYGEMGINPLPNKVSLAIAAWEWPTYLGEKAEKEGLRCQVSSWRRIHASAMPPQAKATANYANASLAKIEALKAGYDEAIMLNQENHVAEATGENVFKVKEGIIGTPPASAGALRGITRDTIIQVAKDMGIEFSRTEFSREELYTSDEVFLTGTAAGVTAVREVDGRKIGNGTEWPVTARLRAAYLDIVHGKMAKYNKWLDYVQQM